VSDVPLARLEDFLRRRLDDPLPGAPAHWRFAPTPPREDWAPDLRPEHARRAAALVLIYPSAHGPAVPLTVRHASLARHAGQVSLPGGAIDPGESAEAAALREAEEEIAVPPSAVRVLGALTPIWIGVSNFLLHPFVGVTDDAPAFRLHPHEVERILEVPVRDLRDARRLKWATRDRAGVVVSFPYFDLQDEVVWGATAMILGEFACLFDAAHAPPPGALASGE
jgi:8-oxo-dGTP pyrophosphatase MutT (NUDIX family)